jgi:hypothetical protein
MIERDKETHVVVALSGMLVLMIAIAATLVAMWPHAPEQAIRTVNTTRSSP